MQLTIENISKKLETYGHYHRYKDEHRELTAHFIKYGSVRYIHCMMFVGCERLNIYSVWNNKDRRFELCDVDVTNGDNDNILTLKFREYICDESFEKFGTKEQPTEKLLGLFMKAVVNHVVENFK